MERGVVLGEGGVVVVPCWELANFYAGQMQGAWLDDL